MRTLRWEPADEITRQEEPLLKTVKRTKKLPASLRTAVDSRPLRGAGRVEDTLNLLGHAAREVVAGSAVLTGSDFESVAQEATIPLVLDSSTKVALDTDFESVAQEATIPLVLDSSTKVALDTDCTDPSGRRRLCGSCSCNSNGCSATCGPTCPRKRLRRP